jgi:cobalt-zinc-cadmium resistance protein CzcA
MRSAELRAKTGETNQLEMITARSQAMEIKNQLQQAKADIGIFSRKLQALLNTKQSVHPADTVLKRISFVPLRDSLSVAQNPLLGLVKQEIDVSHNEKRVEQSRILPDFTIGYFSQTIQGTQDVNGFPRTFGTNYRFNGIQAGISIPLWFSSYTSKIKAAGINENIARTNAESIHKSLVSNYGGLLDEYEKNAGNVDYYEKQALPEATLIIEQSTRSYKAGAMNYLDYVLSLGRAVSIKQNYLDALNNFNQTFIQIENITGKTF